MNYQQWLDFATEYLKKTAGQQDIYLDPKVDACLLLQHATHRTKASIFAFAETELELEIQNKLAVLLDRRSRGEPMAYILAEKEFWSLPLNVSPATLIPRPDTEVLVEKALNLLQTRINSSAFDGHLRLLDLGTGTGAIALALATELKEIQRKTGISFEIVAVDVQPEAVKLARHNANKLQLPLTLLQSYWFDALHTDLKFDLIVSNPPYIDENDPHLQIGDVRFEPRSALVSAEQGYADLRHIIQQSAYFLKAEGWLLLEHGWQQAPVVAEIFSSAGWQQILTALDYAGQQRITFACMEK